MAKIEDLQAQHPDKLGQNWFPPTSLKQLIEQDRVRISGENNALLIEIDGVVWTAPDAWSLLPFRPV